MLSGDLIGPLLLIVSCLWFQLEPCNANSQRKRSKNEQSNFTQLADKYGLPLEEYDVTTEDDYIMKMFRVNGKRRGSNHVPLVLVPGIFDSADAFLLRGENSTGVALAKAGYDLWFCNVRGNKYSRRHKTLDPDKDKKQFWDFSFHEHGYYDLAACIDFVLKSTDRDKIAAIGYSQGTTMFHVLGSTRPEYNSKVELLIAMAPVAYLNNLRPILSDLVPLWPVVATSLKLTGKQELLQDQSAANTITQFVCTLGEIAKRLCVQGVVMPIAGNDTEEFESEFFDIVLEHSPAGTSKKNIDHFAQVVNRKRFANFDRGTIANLFSYGTREPPDYDLTKVIMPIAILAGLNDNIATIEDIALLRNEIPNEVFYKVMDRKEFNHINFIWGKNINVYLNPLLKKLLREFAT